MAGGLGAILSENEQTAKAGVAIYVQHPAMDVPGTAKVIDRANRVQTLPKGKFSERLKEMNEGSQNLLQALMFDNTGEDYPVSFEVTPLRFTVQLPPARNLAQTRGMMAPQRSPLRAQFSSGLQDTPTVRFCPT